MNRQVSPKVTALVIGSLIVVIAVVAWFMFFRQPGSTPEELGIGAPALPGGGTAPPGATPYGPGK